MVVYWKLCKKCLRSYDIGINKDVCPNCRKQKEKEVLNEKKHKGRDKQLTLNPQFR